MRLVVQTAVVGVLLAVSIGASASAKTFEPTKTRDEPVSGDCKKNDCTLRDAVNEANTRPGADKIALSAGKTYTLSEAGTGEDTSVSGDLDTLETLTIETKGTKPATIDAAGIDRVIDTPAPFTGKLTLRNLVVRGGDSSGVAGGGVLARGGKLTVEGAQVIGNDSGANYGGGIGVFGGAAATIRESTLSRNKGEGAGIAVGPSSSALLLSSTVSRNTAQGNGGGIFVGLGGGAELSVTNSTIANNKAGASGGGIAHASNGPIALFNVTIARNVANRSDAGQSGGGIAQLSNGPLLVTDTIVALNKVAGATGTGADCGSAAFAAYVDPGGRNLVSDAEDCGPLADPPNIVAKKPKLGRLADNGGPTETIALKKGSKAIDRAGPMSPSRDQRGVKRKDPDIGAYER